MTITAAPFSSASFNVGSDAVMRCSEVMRPFSIGTFRSWRISTRLPERSRSVMRTMDMGQQLFGGKGKGAAHGADAHCNGPGR
ncbi:hypothetical protein D9M71_729200 [compost metagenome]